MSRFDSLPEFEKELKRLLKKYRTLHDDIEKLKQVLVVHPTGIGKNFTVIHAEKHLKIIKVRMACQTLRDRSLRVIYAYHPSTVSSGSNGEQEQKIEFIELYYKGDKENEDRSRINEYLRSLQS